MDIPLIVARAVHFAGAISLAGLFGFVVLIGGGLSRSLRRRLVVLGWISSAALLLAAPFWLLFVAQGMSGDSLEAALGQGVAATVLGDTQFGHAFALRFVLGLALLPCIAMLGRRRAVDVVAAFLASVLLAATAWQGHAGADIGWAAAIHLAADAAHLVAAGLWLGALLPLAWLLRAPIGARAHYQAACRFSALGVACVAVLLVSGTVNAWYLVGSVPALIGTPYGQALLAKLALVAAMLGLAAINRWRLVPRLLSGDAVARQLARHAVAEAALGLAVIVIVAALGTTIPAAHQQVRWPFPYRLAFSWWPLQLRAVPATPTSYAISPEPFAVRSIAAGSALYAQQCASCHGDDGQGDGPVAAELPVAPVDFAAPSIATRPDGDLFWAVTAGKDGGVMPGFASALDATQRWDLIAYLKSQRQALATSSTLIAEVTASTAPLAPDFTLPSLQGDAGSLQALVARGGVLLVFASLPQSQARLDRLGQWSDALSQAGVAVVTITDPSEIRDVYALYESRPQLAAAPPAAHVEFLIDRDGYIRARWRPGDTPDWDELPSLQREIAAMARLKLPPVAPTGHVHEG